jgi:hypothetical protein
MRKYFTLPVPRAEQSKKNVVSSFRRRTFAPLWVTSPSRKRNVKLWLLLALLSWLGVVIYHLRATDHISPALDMLSNKIKVAGMTTFIVISLTILLAILVFWIITRQKQSDRHLKMKIAELMATNKMLQQEVDDHHLKNKIAELTTINKKLQHEVDELKREQIEILEDVIEAEPPANNIPGFNPQELKALAELAKRLR